MVNQHKIFLLSTVVAPAFVSSTLVLTPLCKEELIGYLTKVEPGNNLCGHPATNSFLKKYVTGLPDPVRGFWNGEGVGIAVRPRKGIRGAASKGDTEINAFADLEWILIEFRKKQPAAPYFSLNCTN